MIYEKEFGAKKTILLALAMTLALAVLCFAAWWLGAYGRARQTPAMPPELQRQMQEDAQDAHWEGQQLIDWRMRWADHR